MASSKTESEQAVRDYLESVRADVSNHPRVAELEGALQDTSDVIEQVKLRQQIDDFKSGTTFRDAFVKNAKAWADREGISAKTLAEMGVEANVLAEAGFEITSLPSIGDGTRAAPNAAPTGGTQLAVRSKVLALSRGECVFPSALANETGASLATVSRALKQLVVDGQVQGPTEDRSDKRRKIYTRS